MYDTNIVIFIKTYFTKGSVMPNQLEFSGSFPCVGEIVRFEMKRSIQVGLGRTNVVLEEAVVIGRKIESEGVSRIQIPDAYGGNRFLTQKSDGTWECSWLNEGYSDLKVRLV